MAMQISERGLNFLKQKEGFRSSAYADGGGTSIGYGHQLRPGENFRTVTREQAETLLRQDLDWAEDVVNRSITAPMEQAEFDAMVSLAYNIGEGAFKKSELVDKFNSGDKKGAAREFADWNKSQGKVHAGLVDRRRDEMLIFTGGSVPEGYGETTDSGADSPFGGLYTDGKFDWKKLATWGGIALVGYFIWDTMKEMFGDFLGTLLTVALAIFAMTKLPGLFGGADSSEQRDDGRGTRIPTFNPSSPYREASYTPDQPAPATGQQSLDPAVRGQADQAAGATKLPVAPSDVGSKTPGIVTGVSSDDAVTIAI